MSSLSTRACCGAMNTWNQTGVDGPMFDGYFSAGPSVDFISALSTIKSRGYRCIINPLGGYGNYQNPDSTFSMGKWKATMDTAAAKTSAKQMGNFFLDGTLFAVQLTDDAKAGSTIFNGVPPTMDEMDSMAAYSKSKWSMVPTCVRIDPTYLKGKSNWTNLDFGIAQWHIKWKNAQTWLTNNINDGRSVGLGCQFGFNLLNGGSGITPPWNQHPDLATAYGMSPQEIDAVANTYSQQTFATGIFAWASDPQFDSIDYYSYPSIQTALQRLANLNVGRVQGPINWREYSPSGSTDTSSGSTVTISGNWTLVDTGTSARQNNVGNFVVSAPANAVAGDLQCLLIHSRDTLRTIERPSGWSEAQRISSNSGAGGELAFFYKLGSASEVDVTVTMSGTGGTGTSQLGRWFTFSHNTTNPATLLATAGSAKSWGTQTGMGPVPGITSTISDALILICAARCDDFGGGSVDENVMSATTGPQTWNRLFSTGNVLGQDNAMFVDWAVTSGTASITTKSWSRTSGTAAGPGAGFMLAFAPSSIVSGQPAAFATEFPDITLSVGSNISTTLQSTGSTPFTYSKVSGPSNVTLNTSTGLFQFTPVSADTYVIQLSTSNSFGSDTATFRVFASSPGGSGSTQTGSNTAPSITHPGDKTVAAHDLLSFLVAATDVNGDRLTFGFGSQPAGAFIDSVTGQFIWVPTGEQAGAHPIVVSVTDGIAQSLSTFTVTVTGNPWTRLAGPDGGFGQTPATSNSFTKSTNLL